MISSIKIVVELFAYLYCLAGLFGKKFKISVYAMILMVLDLFVLTGIREYELPSYLRFLVYVGMFLYGLLYYKESIKVTLINSFVAAVTISIFQTVVSLPLYYIFYVEYRYREIYELLVNMWCCLGICFCNRKNVLRKLSLFLEKRNRLIAEILLLVFGGLGLNLYQIKRSGAIVGMQYVQFIYYLVLFGIIISEWQKSRMDAEKRKMQLEMHDLYYGAYDKLIMLIRERQHDMKNHINAIISMIHTTDNYEELVAKQQEYCGYVLKQNEKTKLLLSSGNPLITGFLYSKMQEAEAKGISVDYCVGIKKNIKFPEYELIEMLGILFDNAIEALEEVEIDKKQIYVSIKENETQIDCIVGNTDIGFEGKMDKIFERGYSSKGENRGIGLAKLKRMVHERNGDLIVSNEMYQDNNYFTFEISLPKTLL